jgi:hypothetical protein
VKSMFISILILISEVIPAQECKIDLHSLAQPGYNMNRFNKFGQSRLFNIVLSEGFDTIANQEIIYQLSQWFLNQNGQCLSYQISGLFVKFLIDKYGIDRLKRFYNCPDITEGFKTIYNLELHTVVSEWKSFILKNNE